MSPKISIIVPSYNEEKNIVRCLDSILNQTFTDFEVICVDDNSTDSTFDILSDYAKKDSRIIPLKNTGKGVSSARNYGIDNSHGEYIGFVDSDDFIQPQMYEFLYKAIIENDCDMSCCGFIRTDKQNINHFTYNSRKCTLNEFLNYENENPIIVVSVCNKLINSDLFKDKIRFESYKYGEDSLFSTILWNKTDKIFFVNLPLYNYYTNYSSVSYIDESDIKRIDRIFSDYEIYKIYLEKKNYHALDFCVDLNLTFLISYRYEISQEKSNKRYIKEINKIGKHFLNYYLKSKTFPLTKKIYFLTSFYCPYFYYIYRKLRLKIG